MKTIRLLLLSFAVLVAWSAGAANRKLVMIAGTPSHGPLAHEFNAGVQLLAKCLKATPGLDVVVNLNGWPKDESIFNGADAVLIYADGGGGHPAIQGNRLQTLDALMKKGVGLALAHSAVEVPKDKGGPEFLRWTGGYFEMNWSVNPHWTADFRSFPQHPITRGVEPFAINDEWYFHMRFPEGMKGVTPILTTVAPDSTMTRGDGPHSGNPAVREAVKTRVPQHMAWATERADGGRGFGFTGGHGHMNWGNDNFRKLVLNSLLWVAKVEVPADGVASKVSPDDLAQNLDPKAGARPAVTPTAPATKAAPKAAGPAPRPTGLQQAKDDLQKFTVADGLEVTLFAHEPMVRKPSNFDIDARGRVWVTEAMNYRSTFQRWGILRPEGDRVLILEDTDGDGMADKEKTFHQGPEINAALGICVLGNRAIVSRSPDIFVLTDTDSDDKADKVEKLFSGMKGVDHDHGVHAFVFGPDGKLYFNFGNSGDQLKTPDGSQFITDLAGNEVKATGKPYRQGMVFRSDLDGKNLETLGWNFRNNYEVAVDSFGTLWQSDNDDDGNRATRFNYVMEFGNYGYVDEFTGAGWRTKRTNLEKTIPEQHWHLNDPGVVPTPLINGAGSPTGITVYEGSLLPAKYRGQVLHCDAGPNEVRLYISEPDGAGYKTRSEVLLKSRDSWFRPSDVCVAPDGSVLVADWYDPGVGGHNMGDNKADSMHGRIYRIAPVGSKYSVPKQDVTTAKGALAALQSPNLNTRTLAWQSLHAMGSKAEGELKKLWNGKDPFFRARALQLLARIPKETKGYVASALKDKDANIRITGLRIAREEKLDVIPLVKQLASDASPQVRRECAIALRHSRSPEAAALWTKLALQHDGKDRWYLEALGIGADRNDEVFFDKWLAAVGNKWNTPAGRDIIWRSRASKVPALLVKIITDKATTETDKPRYLRALDFQKGPEKEKALLDLLTAG